MKWLEPLARAISKHKKVELIYDGEKRRVAPHILGLSSVGNLILSTFQFKNLSDSSTNNQWRSFDVRKITSLKILKEKFHPHSEYNPHDKTFRQIIVQV